MSYANLPAPSPEQGLKSYLREIRRFPILDQEEEYMLARRWIDDRDTESAHKLVTSHLRLAASVARGYRGYGLPEADVISEANIGLMRAVKRFDPEKGFRLSTYAMWWIRASIQEFILRSWSLVKIAGGNARKKLFFNLRKAKARIGAYEDGNLRPENLRRLADDLGASEEEVNSMHLRLSASDSSLNTMVGGGNEGDDGVEWQDWLEDDGPGHVERIVERDENRARGEVLIASMDALNDREKDILMERRLKDEPTTLDELSKRHGVSRERIRQIELRAFEKLRERARGLAEEKGLIIDG